MARFFRLSIAILITMLAIQTSLQAQTISAGGLVKTSWVGQSKGNEPMFGVDLARFHVFGTPVNRVSALLQINFITDFNTPAADIKAAFGNTYASVLISEALTINMGYGKKPFGLEWTTDEAKHDFFGEALLARTWGTRDLGIWIDLTTGPLFVRLGAFNGKQALVSDDNESPAAGARLRYQLIEGLSLGTSFWYQHVAENNQTQVGADVEYNRDPFKIAAEFAFEKTDVGYLVPTAIAGGNGKTWDAYVSAVYRLIGRNHIGARYEINKLDMEKKRDDHYATAQYSYLFTEAIKASLDLTYYWIRGTDLGTQENILTYRVGLQAAF